MSNLKKFRLDLPYFRQVIFFRYLPIVGRLKGQIIKFASKYYFTNFFKLTSLKSLEY